MGLLSHAEADKAAAERIVGWYLSASGEREAFVALEWHESEPDGARFGSTTRADDGARTRDLRLGKPTLYQLSYVRVRASLARP